MEELRECMAQAEDQEEFLQFLTFCLERIDKDEPTQAIWHDWIQTVAQR